MRARVAITVLGFFAVLAAAGTPPSTTGAAAAVDRAQTLGGEIERTPCLASHGTGAQLSAARAARARPGPWKLPPLAFAPDLSPTPVPTASTRARVGEAAGAPIAPPSSPRSCRGPPRA